MNPAGVAPTSCAPRAERRSPARVGRRGGAAHAHDNLDPEVAERPEEPSVVLRGAARGRVWEATSGCDDACGPWRGDRPCWVRSRARPVGVFRTHAGRPALLIANSAARRDEYVGALMGARGQGAQCVGGQMTAGSWIYIGSQASSRARSETFGRKCPHFGGSLAGRLVPDRRARPAWGARRRWRRP